MAEDWNLERRGLLLSIWGALGMAGLGFGFSAGTGSEAVFLDGVFSLIGFAVGLLALKVASVVRRPADEVFHFGYAAYEPFLNLAKGLLIAFVSLVAFFSAVDVILRGGRQVNGIMAVVYAVVAALGCLGISFTQKRLSRKTASPLLAVDAKNWLIDGLISGAVAVAFLVTVLLEGSRFAALLPYADPAVVVLLVLLSVPIPIQIIRTNWGQLVGRAPDQEAQAEAEKIVSTALEEVSGAAPHLRLLEMGRSFLVHLYLVVESGSPLDNTEAQDNFRQRLWASLERAHPNVSMEVVFTRDSQWAEKATGEKEQNSKFKIQSSK